MGLGDDIRKMNFRRKVQKGTGTGTKIGYPTLNFNVGHFGKHYGEGVYDSEVKIGSKIYKGALYFGPRLNHPGKVLEIYVFEFSKKIYNQFAAFRVLKKIRKPKTFKSLEELKKQIKKDLMET